MACFLEPSKPEWYRPRTAEEMRACAHVRGVFGRKSALVRSLSAGRGKQDVCIVKVARFSGASFEFICMGGLLVGVPPKRSGGK